LDPLGSTRILRNQKINLLQNLARSLKTILSIFGKDNDDDEINAKSLTFTTTDKSNNLLKVVFEIETA